MRERHDDSISQMLCFTFPELTGRGSRSVRDFRDPQHVPDFEGETGWFELGKVQATPWPYWHALRQVERPDA